METIKEEFDSQVKHSPPVTGGKFWLDEWWGPGGHLVVASAGIHGHRETLTTSDGEVLTNVEIKEGADYKLLPQLFGPELWEKREESRLARTGG